MNATSCVLPLKPSTSVDKTKTIDKYVFNKRNNLDTFIIHNNCVLSQNPSIVQIPMEENDNVKPTDSNEKLYCICNQVAYGTMIGCDNRNVIKETIFTDYRKLNYML